MFKEHQRGRCGWSRVSEKRYIGGGVTEEKKGLIT